MARPTITDEITRLENRLAILRAQIDKVGQFRSMEEGSASSRFRTDFTDLTKLRQQEFDIESKLATLYGYQDRGLI